MKFSKGWELRFCILLSLFLQIFLAVAGTFRRLASHRRIVKILWLAYLLAEFVAVFGLGLIVSKQSIIYNYFKDHRFENSCLKVHGCIDNILVYWATFLLVHLGGPDTITAFATEDNELWPRHLFYLFSKCITVAYVIYESVQTTEFVTIPILLMFMYGIIKCTERTCALYYGSAKTFRNSMLPNDDSEDKNISKKDQLLMIKLNGEALSDTEVLQYAFVYFTVFKGLVFDFSISIQKRHQSREFFLTRSSKEAFRLVEVELNYLYDVLFTKIPVLNQKLGLFCRTLSFIAVVSSLVLFYFNFKVSNVKHKHNVVVTYILFLGAIVLEVIAFYMLLFCDWTVVKLRPLSDANPTKSRKDKIIDCILSVISKRSELHQSFLGLVGAKHHQTESKFTDSRWANSLSQFNLIFYCLHRCSKRREKFYTYFGLLRLLNGFLYVKPQPLTHDIANFIFDELKMKSNIACSPAVAKQICSSKGEWVLNNLEEYSGTFLPYVTDYNYDDILLLWHIATELCYNDIQDKVTSTERETSKQLSDYMLFLLVMKPNTMCGVSSIGETKFRQTCTQVSKFFELHELKKRKFCNFFRRESKEEKEDLQRKACEKILSADREVDAVSVQMDIDIFFVASVLAKELKVLPSEKRWLIISKLWVELLSYAASHIRSSAHAEQLSKGGELITVVWLLMAHFGLGDHYEITPVTQESELSFERVRLLSI